MAIVLTNGMFYIFTTKSGGISKTPVLEDAQIFYSVNGAMRKIIYDRSDGHCELCGQRLSLENMTLDYFVPISMGGNDDMDNLQVSCYACNQFKSNILPDDFMYRIIKIFLYQMKKNCGKSVKLKLIHNLIESI